VGCGQGALEILELQRAGGKPLSASEFVRGHPLPAGARLE
jgi:methionyl-tRNA formyltransferase